MHERRFGADIERLRSPQRVALLEVDRVVDFCLEGTRGVTLLDVGTGSGIFAEAFAAHGLSVTAIDPNREMLETARRFVPAAHFTEGVLENLPFQNRSFDLLFLGHVLHESDDMGKALRESRRVAKERVAILEWPYREEEIGPPIYHRLVPERVTTLASTTGFTRIQTITLAHMILFILQ